MVQSAIRGLSILAVTSASRTRRRQQSAVFSPGVHKPRRSSKPLSSRRPLTPAISDTFVVHTSSYAAQPLSGIHPRLHSDYSILTIVPARPNASSRHRSLSCRGGVSPRSLATHHFASRPIVPVVSGRRRRSLRVLASPPAISPPKHPRLPCACGGIAVHALALAYHSTRRIRQRQCHSSRQQRECVREHPLTSFARRRWTPPRRGRTGYTAYIGRGDVAIGSDPALDDRPYHTEEPSVHYARRRESDRLESRP